MPTVREYMTEKVVTAESGDSTADVCRRMRDQGIGAVVLLDAGKVTGLFTERDVLNRVVAEGRDPNATPVGEVATRQVVAVSPDDPVRKCAQMLKEAKLRHLPVVDGGRLCGIVSARDFFEDVAAHLEDLIGRIRYDQALLENTDPYDHLGGSYGR